MLSPEQGVKQIEKPPQNVPLPVPEPSYKSAVTSASPFSDAKAAEALGQPLKSTLPT